MECGHVGIGGRSVSGKSTFLQTFIFSLLNKYSEKDITLYILDFNGGGMDIYTIASQVQQVIKEEEEEKTDGLELLETNLDDCIKIEWGKKRAFPLW